MLTLSKVTKNSFELCRVRTPCLEFFLSDFFQLGIECVNKREECGNSQTEKGSENVTSEIEAAGKV